MRTDCIIVEKKLHEMYSIKSSADNCLNSGPWTTSLNLDIMRDKAPSLNLFKLYSFANLKCNDRNTF